MRKHTNQFKRASAGIPLPRAVRGTLMGLAVVAALTLSACATLSAPSSEPSSEPAPTHSTPPLPYGWPGDLLEVSQSSPEAPAEFRERASLSLCPVVVLEQGKPMPGDMFDCLNNGFDSGAEMVMIQPTTEGDPVVTYYRVGPGIDGVDIYTDMTADRFGSGWHIQHCTTTNVNELSGCVEG